jgi:hypothetical protein
VVTILLPSAILQGISEKDGAALFESGPKPSYKMDVESSCDCAVSCGPSLESRRHAA